MLYTQGFQPLACSVDFIQNLGERQLATFAGDSQFVAPSLMGMTIDEVRHHVVAIRKIDSTHLLNLYTLPSGAAELRPYFEVRDLSQFSCGVYSSELVLPNWAEALSKEFRCGGRIELQQLVQQC